jgi:hypothetical protein
MTYQVDIKRREFKKIELTRALRTLSPSFKLNQVMEMVTYINNHGTATLVAGIDEDVANHIKEQMDIEGIEVVVNKSSVKTPMVMFPSTNQKWEWGKLRNIKKAM